MVKVSKTSMLVMDILPKCFVSAPVTLLSNVTSRWIFFYSSNASDLDVMLAKTGLVMVVLWFLRL
jgi:hypothetical protein